MENTDKYPYVVVGMWGSLIGEIEICPCLTLEEAEKRQTDLLREKDIDPVEYFSDLEEYSERSSFEVGILTWNSKNNRYSSEI